LDAIQAGEIPIGRNPLSGASSPIFDDWLPPNVSKDYPDLIRAMIVLDETNLHSILDFTDMSDYELTEPTLNWLRRTYSSVTEFGKNIFWVRLWAWDRFSGYNEYSLNDQLQLNSDLALDPRINYHVSIGVNINPEVLDESVWEHLRNDRDMLEEWLKVVAPGLGDVVNTILIDYNERFRDVFEVGFFDNPPPYDPTIVRPLPHYVIERIREILTYPGGGYFDGNHPNIYDAVKIKDGNSSNPAHPRDSVIRNNKVIVNNPRLRNKSIYLRNKLNRTIPFKTVMIYGVLARKKGIKYAEV
jgi:hypothetical protein